MLTANCHVGCGVEPVKEWAPGAHPDAHTPSDSQREGDAPRLQAITGSTHNTAACVKSSGAVPRLQGIAP